MGLTMASKCDILVTVTVRWIPLRSSPPTTREVYHADRTNGVAGNDPQAVAGSHGFRVRRMGACLGPRHAREVTPTSAQETTMFQSMQDKKGAPTWLKLLIAVAIVGAIWLMSGCASASSSAVGQIGKVGLAPMSRDSAMRADQVKLRSQAIGAVRDVGVADASRPSVIWGNPYYSGYPYLNTFPSPIEMQDARTIIAAGGNFHQWVSTRNPEE
jgi:hypothetical protein